MATISRLLVIGVLLAPVCALGGGRPPTPDPDLLEYLGSFATASGKPLDPMLFSEQEKSTVGQNRRASAPEKKKRPRKPDHIRKDHADDD